MKRSEKATGSSKALQTSLKNPEATFASLELPNREYSLTDEQTLKHLLEVHFPSFTKLEVIGEELSGPCPVRIEKLEDGDPVEGLPFADRAVLSARSNHQNRTENTRSCCKMQTT